MHGFDSGEAREGEALEEGFACLADTGQHEDKNGAGLLEANWMSALAFVEEMKN